MSPEPKKEEPKGSRDKDGFFVEEDGLVDIRLELRFTEDLQIRVAPDVAKRIMDGEFDGQDPDDIPGVNMADLMSSVGIEVETSYEWKPQRPEPGKDGASFPDDDDDDVE